MDMSLSDVVTLAHKQSPFAQAAEHNLRSKYWQYRSFRASYLPSLNLTGTVPSFNRSINRIVQDNGRETFVQQQQANSSLSLDLRQNVGWTGGFFNVTSAMQRIDYLVDTQIVSYLATPINIGFTQPILQFNRLRWEKKIEPIKYQEAKRQYLQDLENVSIQAVNNFFDLFLAQINLEIAELNQANNDTLFRIAKGRYNLGKIAENELLQMELAFLNSNLELTRSELEVEIKTSELRNFLGIGEEISFRLHAPDTVPAFVVDLTKALTEAKIRGQKPLEFERRLLEAHRDLARARGENGFNANLFGTYGLTRSAFDLEGAYRDPDDAQQVVIGLSVPILDWGRARGQVKMARSGYDLVQTLVEQDEVSFEKEVFIQVMRFNMQPEQVRIATKADTIGQKRYYVTKQRYLIGKIDITELNIALREKDLARRGYVEALRNYWTDFYRIRLMTLFDFEKNAPLIVDESVIKN
jgi:outer membrane protein TolC